MASRDAAMTGPKPALCYAWAAALAFSILPVILCNEPIGGDAQWINYARPMALILLIAAGLLAPALRSAWKVPAVLLAVGLAGLIMERLRMAGTLADLAGSSCWRGSRSTDEGS